MKKIILILVCMLSLNACKEKLTTYSGYIVTMKVSHWKDVVVLETANKQHIVMSEDSGDNTILLNYLYQHHQYATITVNSINIIDNIK